MIPRPALALLGLLERALVELWASTRPWQSRSPRDLWLGLDADEMRRCFEAGRRYEREGRR